MNLHPRPRTESWHSRYQSTKGTLTTSRRCSAGDLILGTDFRHAVEFSRSGRAKNPALRPSSSAGFPTLHRAPQQPHLKGSAGGFPDPRRPGPFSLGAERTIHALSRPCTRGSPAPGPPAPVGGGRTPGAEWWPRPRRPRRVRMAALIPRAHRVAGALIGAAVGD